MFLFKKLLVKENTLACIVWAVKPGGDKEYFIIPMKINMKR